MKNTYHLQSKEEKVVKKNYRYYLLHCAITSIIIILFGTGLQAQFNFGTPINLGSIVNSPAQATAPSISADGLSLYFDILGSPGGHDLWVTTRATVTDPWGTPVNLGATVNSSDNDAQPSISADDLSLYFSSTRQGVPPELWVTTRATISDPWGTPVRIESPSSGGGWSPSISANDLTLYFSSTRTGTSEGLDLWMYTRAAISDPWVLPPVNLGPTINSSSKEMGVSISANELILFFGSDRSGGEGSFDIWVTTRTTVSDPWGTPVNLGSIVNTSFTDEFPNISSDGLILYFGSDRPGGAGFDIWQVDVNPTGINEIDGELPTTFSLLQNYPNPFNPSTKIEFSLPQTSYVTLEVFNTLGERVGVLASEELSAGTYNYIWDAADLTSGIYFYGLQAGDFIQTKKMVLLK